MDMTRLVNMANRIGDFFEAIPDANAGLDGVAGHIAAYWEPRMRRQLADYLDAALPAPGLSPFVEEALRSRPQRWRVKT